MEQAQQQIVVPRSKGEIFSGIALKAAGLRPSMWVANKAGVIGILTACAIDGIAEVTMSKPDGNTKMMLDENDRAVPAVYSARVEDLRQAYIDEIPEQRRPDEAVLLSLGYKYKEAV